MLSIGACAIGLRRLARPQSAIGLRRVQYSLLGFCTVGCVLLFLYRALVIHHNWQPLESHVDGLLLIASLFAVMVLFLQSRGGVQGLTAFALPVLSFILAWSVCASAWTMHLFHIDSIWKAFHLAGVYLGTLMFAIAAIGGGMFLYSQRRLRTKRAANKLASLEKIEGLIVWTSTLGFGLLTLGLVSGVIVISSGSTRLGAGWWYSSKIILATSVWLIYAVVMNTRHSTTFRGARAAWLSILGLVLLLATFGIVTAGLSADGSDAVLHEPNSVVEMD